MLDWRKSESGGAPGVLAPAATGAAGFIEQNGGDADRVFGRSGIEPEAIDNPVLGLQLECYCGLFEEAARQTRNDNFGLWFGNQFLPRDL
ncbi:MAG: AraC family transcriptional regulator ligand-binding domain-containing protein, partial [Kiloniellales bacterium]